MNEQKLRQLWEVLCTALKGTGADFTSPVPDVEGVEIKGNRADVITYTLAARIVDEVAYVAKDSGKTLSALALHERMAQLLPDVIEQAKRLKRGVK